MGLGKTVQVLALLLGLSGQPGERRPSLLVAPASLLANWAAEAARFAPSLKVFVAHPSFAPADRLAAPAAESLQGIDIVVTSYGSALRLDWIGKTRWRLLALDEAQAIKNPQREADPRRQGAARGQPGRADRHADREQSARPLVDLRLSQPRASRIVEGLRRLRQASRRQGARLLRAPYASWSGPTSFAG